MPSNLLNNMVGGVGSEQGLEHLNSLHNRLVIQYCNTGDAERTVEKLAQHQTLLNVLYDRGTLKKINI